MTRDRPDDEVTETGEERQIGFNDRLWRPAPAAEPAPNTSPRARLVVLQGSQVGRRYPLDAVSSLGRSQGCTVALDDPMTSRRHAMLNRQADGTWEIADLGSRNAILVNGAVVLRARVGAGDRIQLGGTVLLLAHVDPLEDRILHRERLEAIGRLGAGIAHDINNILNGILMNAEFLIDADKTLTDDETRAALIDLRASARLGAELTRKILGIARRSTGEHAQVDLSALTHEAVDLARRTFDQRVKVVRAVDPGVHVRGDRGQLHQVLMNLLLNARDAVGGEGTVTVRIAHSTPREVGADVAIAGRHATLVVEDTGVGIDEATRARIFEPFFTTKADGGGSGLGLATVHEIVAGHGGSVTCESEPGAGTRFRVVLPALTAVARPESHTPIATMRCPPVGATGTLLVVDDEPVSLRSACRLLARDGHVILSASNGLEALAVFTREQAKIDLVLMDLDMPELDGERAFHAMRALRPDVRVVFLTGFIEPSRQTELISHGAMAILGKPCPVEALRGTIASALMPTAQDVRLVPSSSKR